jgi:metal-dependent hydrolase (beta-lactamase superfamily II)
VEPSEAVRELLGAPCAHPTRDDLVEAAKAAMERRRTNTLVGGVVLAALHDEHGLTWRQIAELTGIDKQTAYRWADQPR